MQSAITLSSFQTSLADFSSTSTQLSDRAVCFFDFNMHTYMYTCRVKYFFIATYLQTNKSVIIY